MMCAHSFPRVLKGNGARRDKPIFFTELFDQYADGRVIVDDQQSTEIFPRTDGLRRIIRHLLRRLDVSHRMAPSALKAKLRSRLLLQDKKTDKGVVSGTYSIHQTFILICNKVVNFSPLIIGKMFFGPAVMSLTQSEDFEDRAGVHDAN